jgi:competence protein ComEC
VLAVTLSFICGIAIHRFLPLFPLSILTLAAISFLLIYRINRKRALIIMAFLAFGFIYTWLRSEPYPETDLPDRGSSLTGMINDVPEIKDGTLSLTVDRVSINGMRLDGRVMLFADAQEMNRIPESGDIITAFVRLKRPLIFKNPGVYTYDPRRRGILASGSVSFLRITGSAGGLRNAINNERQRLGWIIDRSLSPRSASLIKAIIPGLKRGIDKGVRDDFSRTGLAHLLSISGTHFGLLAFLLFKVVRMIIRLFPLRILNRLTLYVTPSQISILLTMPVLLLYAGISGASIPTIRSLIMISIYMTALFMGRRDQWLNSLSIAAFIILLWNPSALFEISFLLSFLAVLSIGLVLERMAPVREEAETRREGIIRYLKTASLITLSAVLGTAPFIILYFKQFPIISPVTNLLITPIVCFVILPLGFVSCFTALILGLSSLPFNHLIDSITGFTIKLVGLFADIPFAGVHLHNPSHLLIVLYYLSIILIVMHNHRLRFLPLGMVIFLFLIRPHIHGHEMRITILDVGQGDSSVIELPDGRVMLIDGGPQGSDAGRRVVAPYLWSRGIGEIDILVLSHPHYDHYGGLLYILDNLDVGEVWLNGRFVEDALPFFEKLVEKSIPYRILRRGDSFSTGDYMIIILHPYDGFYADSERGGFSDENNDSLVLKIQAGDFSMLFPGDIESEAERDILHLGRWLRSDIIKVPHHGGKISSTPGFIASVDPDVAIISVGEGNTFNHPHREAIERYLRRGVRLYRTDRDGAVIITTKDGEYSIKTYRDYQFKEVSNIYDEIHNLKLLYH